MTPELGSKLLSDCLIWKEFQLYFTSAFDIWDICESVGRCSRWRIILSTQPWFAQNVLSQNKVHQIPLFGIHGPYLVPISHFGGPEKLSPKCWSARTRMYYHEVHNSQAPVAWGRPAPAASTVLPNFLGGYRPHSLQHKPTIYDLRWIDSRCWGW